MKCAWRAFARQASAFRDNQSGATAIEYGLIVSLIFLAIVGSIRAYTNSTSGMYSTIEDTLDTAGQ